MIYFFKFPLVDTLGGGEFHTLELAKGFASQGESVKLFSSDRELLMLFAKANLPQEYVFCGWEPTSKWSLLLWPLTTYLAQKKFQSLLPQIFPGSTVIMQSLVEKLLLTPLLSRASSGIIKIFWMEHKIPGSWLKHNPLLQRFLKLASRVQLITVSNFAKQKFLQLGLSENIIQVIYPSVSQPVQTKKINSSDKEFRLGILGRLDPEKGVLDFIKTVSSNLPTHPNWKIYIAGQGTEERLIKKYLNRQNLENQVKLLGFITDLDQFFSQISVLVYPSQAPEAFGMSVVEAQIRGVPVVATNQGALAEIIDHGKTGYLTNLEGMTNIIKKLENPNLYSLISQQSKQSAQNFSLQTMLKSFATLIKTDTQPF